MIERLRKIHFIGIAGIGMCSLAEIMLKKNIKVSGSDRAYNEITDKLIKMGAEIFQGHRADNVKDVDLVVYTSAVSNDNPELQEAIRKGIPAIKRAEMLAELVRLQYVIGVSGTHGKTTTTSMVGLVLREAGLDPTIIVGGKVKAFEGNTIVSGNGKYAVVEADEFDRSFLKLNPAISVITSIEEDHLDTYKDITAIKEAFIDFANKVPFYGFVILCSDEEKVVEILPSIKRKVLTYGINSDADLKAKNIKCNELFTEYEVVYKDQVLGKIKLNVPGKHNVKNSLAAILIGKELRIGFEIIAKSLEKFDGVERRLDIKANINNILVIDDYAHHPTEVSATLNAIKSGWNRRIISVFQPHLYTRTRDLYVEFANSFLQSDIFICTDVYPARELPIEGITGELIINEAKKLGHKNAIYVQDKNEIPEELLKIVKPDDIVITMGAGDINIFGEKFIELLKQR